ncbi:putative SUF system FeS cluster assembly, SufBD [Dioscorea sansibarensis]
MAISFFSSLLPPLRLRSPNSNPNPKPKTLAPVRASLSDPFVLSIAEKLEDSLPSSPPSLQSLRSLSSQSLLSKPWPSRKDEPFRFTDTSFLKSSQILPVSSPNPPSDPGFDSHSPNLLVVVDGHPVPSLSCLSSLPSGVVAGSLSSLPPGPVLDRVLAVTASEFADGDLFWDLNGLGAPDVLVVYVPEGARVVEEPLHLVFCSTEGEEVGSGRLPVSNPRVLLIVEKRAQLTILEEHLGIGDCERRCYWANSAMEILIGEGGMVKHSYVQRQSLNAAHIKWTSARQEAASTYELVEVSTGGRLSRHNIHIQQLGPETMTEMSAFHLAQSNQTQDLHSKLVLDYPRGYSRQLHKCIVSDSSGHAVFDGNIKVNRYAQQTDAGQLTRTLLMAPRATVNLKPNLQIIADDVKCSHGAAISDLEEDQLFYLQTRGIDQQTAREALVFAFGKEVITQIPFVPLQETVTSQFKELLAAK